MSSFHKNHGPMTSGGCGSTSQLTITNPTGLPPAQTTRYHGLAWGYPAACASALRTDPTNRSCPGATRSARTASRFRSVISPRVTATGSTYPHGGGLDGAMAVAVRVHSGRPVERPDALF